MIATISYISTGKWLVLPPSHKSLVTHNRNTWPWHHTLHHLQFTVHAFFETDKAHLRCTIYNDTTLLSRKQDHKNSEVNLSCVKNIEYCRLNLLDALGKLDLVTVVFFSATAKCFHYMSPDPCGMGARLGNDVVLSIASTTDCILHSTWLSKAYHIYGSSSGKTFFYWHLWTHIAGCPHDNSVLSRAAVCTIVCRFQIKLIPKSVRFLCQLTSCLVIKIIVK